MIQASPENSCPSRTAEKSLPNESKKPLCTTFSHFKTQKRPGQEVFQVFFQSRQGLRDVLRKSSQIFLLKNNEHENIVKVVYVE